MNNEISRRLTQIESHIAHLENQVEQLNAVVVDQSRTIERLKKEARRHSDALQTMELDRIKTTNPKPPHYQ
jgi:SlyX protein